MNRGKGYKQDIIVDLRGLLPDKASKAHIAEYGSPHQQGIGQNHGQRVWDATAQDDQKHRTGLKGKIEDQEAHARKSFAALTPQKQDDQRAEDIGDYMAKYDCPDVKKGHELPLWIVD